MQHKRSNNPDFQARHYRQIAQILHDFKRVYVKDGATGINASDAHTILTARFQGLFAEDSPNFDSVRFYDAAHQGKGL